MSQLKCENYIFFCLFCQISQMGASNRNFVSAIYIDEIQNVCGITVFASYLFHLS